MNHDLNQSKVDPCLSFRIKDEEILIVTGYIHNILFFRGDRDEIQKLKEKMNYIFEFKDLRAHLSKNEH